MKQLTTKYCFVVVVVVVVAAMIGGQSTGAMSWAFREAYRRGGPNQTYVQLLGNIRKLLYGKYTQIPQMSTGHRMNMKTTFSM